MHKFVLLAAVSGLAVSSTLAHAEIATDVAASGLNAPIFVGTPGGDDRLFVLERGGSLRVVDNGSLLGTPYTTGTGQPLSLGGEGGTLGLAFHPNFLNPGTTGYGELFLNYTTPNNIAGSPFSNVIERVTLDDPTSNTPSVLDRETVLSFAQPDTNHNGGWLGFSPTESLADGANLYIATGDGGGGNDPNNNAQTLTTRLGKILRVNVDGDDFAADPDQNYAIPDSNPFAATSGPELDEIFAYGLRNPFRNGFDRDNGDLYIGDVGQNTREEIDLLPDGTNGGQNFGWRLREGDIATPTGGVGGAPPAGNVDPIFDYTHASLAEGSGSITGGYIYRGTELGPRYDGLYFFADYVNGQVWTINPNAADIDASLVEITDLLFPGGRPTNSLVSFGEDADGELYLVDIGGTVYAIVPEPASLGMLAMSALLLRRRRR